METVLRNFGNSVGLVIPKPVRDSMRLQAGQTVQLEASEKGLLIRPTKRKYTLDELIAQCNRKAPMPKELADWQDSRAVGREIW